MAESIEIRWHGRGGQGTVTAAKVFADACLSGGRYVQAFPEYGPERAGAPLRAFTRISDRELRLHCPVTKPDIVVIVDATLIDNVNIQEGTDEDAVYIVNSSKSAKEVRSKLNAKPGQKVYTVDATKIAVETIGRPLPNATLVGALSKVSGLISLDAALKDVEKSFGKKFSRKIIEGNLDATRRGYEEVVEG
ncbi:MAG TPA: 2-oxoacid:acceptor oxidoreductase family protein [Dissulfurispiraceae bacterium]|nr:2-oxoacid:acceptor oxidoreductase family protein [Dissulfurispiraceae bacterium]